jgi:hypothetical protein
MAHAVTHIPAHHERDPDFNAKAPHYKTAYFSEVTRAAWPHLTSTCVRVAFNSMEANIKFGENEPMFRVYATMDDQSFIGHYFARALKDFVL